MSLDIPSYTSTIMCVGVTWSNFWHVGTKFELEGKEEIKCPKKKKDKIIHDDVNTCLQFVSLNRASSESNSKSLNTYFLW